MGGWLDKKTGKIHLDIAERVPRDQAEKLGRERGELAGFDLDALEEMRWDTPKAPKVTVGEPALPPAPKIVQPTAEEVRGFGLGGYTPEQVPLEYYFGRGTPPTEMMLAYQMSREAFDPRGPYKQFLEKGRKFGSSSPWYTSTKDIYRDAADEIGEAAAADRVNRLLGGFMPASTARSAPPSNLQRAFMWQHLADRGLITPEMLETHAIELANPFGHFAQTTAHQPALARFLRTGKIDPEINPKPASFGQNLTGNQKPGTFDTVMSRIAAAIEPGLIGRFLQEKPIINKKTGRITGFDYSPKDWAYEPMERGLADAADEARALGLLDDVPPEIAATGPYQSIGWHGATGSAEYGSMSDVWRALRKEAATIWGVSEAEANRRIWKEGKVPLLPEGVKPLVGLTPFD